MQLARQEAAPAALAQQLGLEPRAPVFHTLIVHSEEGVPLQCEDRYVNPACAPGYLAVDFTQTTPTHYLFEVTALWRAQYSIEAALPTRAGSGVARHRRARSLPRRRAPHLHARRRDHPRAPGAAGFALHAARRVRAMSPAAPAGRPRWIATQPTAVCAADVAPQAWRNGGGSTRELLAWPAGADWRLRAQPGRHRLPTARSRPSPACSAGSR